MDWRNIERFPPVTTDGWQARRHGRRHDIVGQVAVEAAVAGYNPLGTLLVAVPGSERFLPVLNIEELKVGAQKSFKFRCRINLSLMVISFTLSISLGMISADAEILELCYLFLGSAIFIFFDYWMILRHMDALAERALFNFHIRESGRADLLLWGGVMLAAGAVQVVGQYVLGGFEPLVMKYGVFYAALSAAECWRVLVGPFFHASVLHWVSNGVILIFIGMIAGTISRRHSVAVFLLGSAMGAWATGVVAAGNGYDSYVGVSAGVSALFGLCIAFAWRQPRRFPSKFAVTLIAFSLMEDYLSWISNPDVSLVAHWTGLGVGIVWGLLLYEWIKYYKAEGVSMGMQH